MNLTETVSAIAQRILRPFREPVIQAAGRECIYDDAAQKYVPIAPDTTPAETPTDLLLSDVQSVIDWSKKQTIGVIHVSQTGATTVQSPLFKEQYKTREKTTKAFYSGYCPGQCVRGATMGYEDMLSWLELVGDRVCDSRGNPSAAAAEGFRLALKSISAVEGRTATFEQKGGVTKYTAKGSSDVDVQGQIPARIKARIPFGDPTCECTVEWALQVTATKDGGLNFSLRHLISDGAFDCYAAWMRSALTPLSDGGWLVVVGP